MDTRAEAKALTPPDLPDLEPVRRILEDAGRAGSRVALTVERDHARAEADVRALLGYRRTTAGSGDAMLWTPPADGEETPPCPA